MSATQEILTKDQVKTLSKDINIKIHNDLQKLIDTEKIKLQPELDKYLETETVLYKEMEKLYSEIGVLIDKYNINIKPLHENDRYIRVYSYYFSKPAMVELENIQERITDKFYTDKGLIKDLFKVIEVKVDAILCTLTNVAYEDIVKAVYDKLNLNDLFDNRQQYLN